MSTNEIDNIINQASEDMNKAVHKMRFANKSNMCRSDLKETLEKIRKFHVEVTYLENSCMILYGTTCKEKQ